MAVISVDNKYKTAHCQDHRELREEEDGWAEQQARVVDFLLKTCRLNFTADDIMWAIGQFEFICNAQGYMLFQNTSLLREYLGITTLVYEFVVHKIVFLSNSNAKT